MVPPEDAEACELSILDALQHCGHAGAEIEWRAGARRPDGTFESGIPKAEYDLAKSRCENNPKFTRLGSLQTTERIANDGLREISASTGKTCWMYKQKISTIDADAFRVSIARETLLTGEPPDHPPLTHTRRKDRECFRYRMFRIDLTRVTKDIDDEDYSYELELEVEHPMSLFVYEMRFVCESAARLLAFLLADDVSL